MQIKKNNIYNEKKCPSTANTENVLPSQENDTSGTKKKRTAIKDEIKIFIKTKQYNFFIVLTIGPSIHLTSKKILQHFILKRGAFLKLFNKLALSR